MNAQNASARGRQGRKRSRTSAVGAPVSLLLQVKTDSTSRNRTSTYTKQSSNAGQFVEFCDKAGLRVDSIASVQTYLTMKSWAKKFEVVKADGTKVEFTSGGLVSTSTQQAYDNLLGASRTLWRFKTVEELSEQQGEGAAPFTAAQLQRWQHRFTELKALKALLEHPDGKLEVQKHITGILDAKGKAGVVEDSKTVATFSMLELVQVTKLTIAYALKEGITAERKKSMCYLYVD
jgi:hypothetical protein